MSSEFESSPRRQKAKTFFDYGNDAAMKNNYDYAIQMYQEACKLDPEKVLYRQALRGVARRKFGNEPSKVGRLVGAKNQPIRLRARAERAKKNWSNVLAVCEEAFLHNPWDIEASQLAAEAAEQLGLKALAMWLIESVYPQAADDAGFLRYAAHIYELNESWPKAITCWEKVRKLQPSDEMASRKINSLSASATITRSGLGAAIEKSKAAAERAPSAAELEAESLKRDVLSPEDRWLKEIQEQPDHPGPYLRLADHYRGHNRLDDAEKLLAKAIQAVPGDTLLLEAHAEVQIARLKRAIASWSKRFKENPGDAEAKTKLQQLKAMLADYEIKEYRRRVALRPEDAELHYELGLRLARRGKHDEAIAEFQHARNSATHKVKALHQLGLSFEANGVLKLAERSYQDALKAVDADDQGMLNPLHYRLGVVYETMGDRRKAEEHFNEVAANDYGYLDVAQRLKALSQPD